MYRQVADALRDRIDDHTVGEGQALPSEQALVSEFGVGRSTVRHAIDVLRAEGLIVTRQGLGSRVQRRRAARVVTSDRYTRATDDADDASPAPGTGDDQPQVRVDLAVEDAPDDVAGRLALGGDRRVLRRHSHLVEAGRVVRRSVSWVPYRLVARTAVCDPANEPWPGGTVARLAFVGTVVTGVHEDVSARPATPDEAHALGVRPGAVVLAVVRTMLAAASPVETADIAMATDRYRLHYHVPVTPPPRPDARGA